MHLPKDLPQRLKEQMRLDDVFQACTTALTHYDSSRDKTP
jgi:hypothetical protein